MMPRRDIQYNTEDQQLIIKITTQKRIKGIIAVLWRTEFWPVLLRSKKKDIILYKLEE